LPVTKLEASDAILYRREVHDLFVRDPYGRRLMVGETFNDAGNWSSYPPHKHDGRDGEPVLEEVYYYRVDPADGFGLQVQYTADGEHATHQVRDGDLVLLPYGYHPACAPPGYWLYYLWALPARSGRSPCSRIRRIAGSTRHHLLSAIAETAIFDPAHQRRSCHAVGLRARNRQ
jgi:5-deoxy-D-glucuronate isomerase